MGGYSLSSGACDSFKINEVIQSIRTILGRHLRITTSCCASIILTAYAVVSVWSDFYISVLPVELQDCYKHLNEQIGIIFHLILFLIYINKRVNATKGAVSVRNTRGPNCQR